MTRKLITRISNELGNQLFMYASTFAISKKLNRELLIDNETSFKSRKNISRYGLDSFQINSAIASKKDKFLGIKGYIKRKILKKINRFLYLKKFYTENKDKNKITKYHDDFNKLNFSDKVYFEGHFETEKYFLDVKNQIIKEFNFKDEHKYKDNFYFNKINQVNPVSICLRQNRFVEGRGRDNNENTLKSNKFSDEQIVYINKSIKYIKNKIDNPSFYLWSNDLDSINIGRFNTKINMIKHKENSIKNIDKRALDLFLISKCNHHIVIPSSFNWWGAWLSIKNNKIICRPHDDTFSTFKLNNLDFWPTNWIKI